MKLIERVKAILLTPRTEWPVIGEERSTMSDLFVNYVAILAAIPAVYLIIRVFVSDSKKPVWILWLLGTIAFILIFTNRTIIGRSPSLLLESYHLVTWSVLALLVVVLYQRARSVGTLTVQRDANLKERRSPDRRFI